MAEMLVWMSLALGMLLVVGAAYASYRRRKRRAQARSRAALNRLLAEADEIARSHRDAPDVGDGGS